MSQSSDSINIKVEVDVEGQQQLLQYNKAFGALRNSA